MPKFINIKVGESVELDGGRITITLQEKKGRAEGQSARLEINAPQEVQISHVRISARSAAQNGLTVAIS